MTDDAGARGDATGLAATMKAIVPDAYGPPDVRHLEEIDRPEVSDDELVYGAQAKGFVQLPSSTAP